ncbi:MAG: hypothetical protein K9J30_07410 [Bacteroidales bacterium]|nr:hypothetical protein [Bacteroidales bacterium]
MKIDNQRNIYRIWLRKMIITVLFTASVIVIMFLKLFDDPGSLNTKYMLIIAISLIFIIISVVGVMRNPYYFYFDDAGDVLNFRYYPVGFFNSKKNSLQIPKQHFVKFEAKKFFFGMEEKLELYQVYRNKIAKYPPISLSAVNKDDRKKLKQALLKYSRKE